MSTIRYFDVTLLQPMYRLAITIGKAIGNRQLQRSPFQEALLNSSPSPIIVVFFKKLPQVLFVMPGCHLSLSCLVVGPGCHFDRRAENRENIMSTLPSLPVAPAHGSDFERHGGLTQARPFQPVPGSSRQPALLFDNRAASKRSDGGIAPRSAGCGRSFKIQN